jgi:hypothetical protein
MDTKPKTTIELPIDYPGTRKPNPHGPPHGPWYTALSPREQTMIDHALAYDVQFASAGVPGHGAHLLIAKLSRLVDEYAPGYVAGNIRPEDHP